MSSPSLMCVAMLVSALSGPVKVGDQAPPLKIEKWMNGRKVDPTQDDGKHAYLVEFWATWCPPCRKSIPHLNKVHSKNASKGLVVVGISAEDADTVEPFMKTTKMTYTIALDKGGATTDTYLGEGAGIPTAVLVNRKGTVVWVGSPFTGMDYAIDKVLAGAYSLAAAKKVAEKSKAYDSAIQSGDAPRVLAILDDMIKLQPDAAHHYHEKIRILHFLKDWDKIVALRRKMAKEFKDSPDELVVLANSILKEEELVAHDLELAFKTAMRAVELTKRQSADALAALGQVYAETGLCQDAIQSLRAAEKIEKDEAGKKKIAEMIVYVKKLKACQDMAGAQGQ